MSTPIYPPFAPGDVAPATDKVGAADLGKIYTIGNKTYQVVKAHALLTAPAKFILVWQNRAAFTVNTTTTAGSPAVAGFVPAEVSGNIAAGEYFLLLLPQNRVGIKAIASATVTATTDDGKTVQTSTTAGRIVLAANTTVTSASVGFTPVGAAAASAGNDVDIVTL